MSIPENKFYNEVGGIAWDTGSSLLTPEDLRAACTLPSNSDNDWKFRRIQSGAYKMIVMGVDWGGGGQDQTSYTVAAVAGLRGDGKIEIIHGWKSLNPNNQILEAKQMSHLFNRFHCHYIAHDFCGADATREALMVHDGVRMEVTIPISYTYFTTGNLVRSIPYNPDTGMRFHYSMDKPRSLSYLCGAITLGLSSS